MLARPRLPAQRFSDFAPISQLQLQRFKGERWELFSDGISGDVGG
jgi:branched-chain amino acid transport system substrate-binding protein